MTTVSIVRRDTVDDQLAIVKPSDSSPPTHATVLVDGKGNVLKATPNGDGTATLDIDIEGVTVSLGTVKILDSGGTNVASVSAAGAVKVDGSAATQPTAAQAATRSGATTMQNAATASGNGTSLDVTGQAVALLNVVSSPAMSGGTTVNFEASVDDTTWVAIAAHTIGTNGSLATTTTSDGDYRIQCAGYQKIRARISSYNAGTVTVKGYAVPTASAPTAVALASGTNSIGTVIANTPAATTLAVALTGSNQAVAASAKDYRGFSIYETSGTATAKVLIYDNGGAASGTVIEAITLAPGESAREYYDGGGVHTTAGIYVQVVSGAVGGSVRTGP